MIITMIKNTQNKLYTIQFFSLPDDSFTAQKKFELPAKRGFQLPGTEKLIASCTPANPIYKQSMTSVVWNISTGQLGYLSGHAPSQLLHSCSLAE